ncbi:MAG TPA: RNA polymerase sigma factor [Polyangiaceae bacterium]|nr:RNA polymerase sigma factor [Polyangiaceae bacterium]
MQLTDSIHDASTMMTLRASIPDVLPALEARAMRLARSRHDAEDLLQETVVRALRFEGTFQRGTNLRAWMQQILQSVFISRCRRRVRERRALERFTGDPTLTASATAAPVLRSVSNKMHAAYSSLPEKFQQVLELVDVRDFSYREAADHLGVPVGTVMSRLFRARRMLAEGLDRDGARRGSEAVERAALAPGKKVHPGLVAVEHEEAPAGPREPARAA